MARWISAHQQLHFEDGARARDLVFHARLASPLLVGQANGRQRFQLGAARLVEVAGARPALHHLGGDADFGATEAVDGQRRRTVVAFGSDHSRRWFRCNIFPVTSDIGLH